MGGYSTPFFPQQSQTPQQNNPGGQQYTPLSGGSGGGNQFFPTLPSLPNPGVNPSQNNFAPVQAPTTNSPFVNPALSQGGTNQVLDPVGNGQLLQGTQDPQLTAAFNAYLTSMVGKGATPFSGQTQLATGGQTAPGQLNAPLNPLMQQLMTMLSGGQSSIPGGNTLNTIANEGISALPEWQSMIAAMGQNTQQGEANLQEQFASMGALAGSPFGTAMSNFEQQTTLGQNALLGQLQQQNILQGQIPVAQGLQSMASQTGQYLQGLNQQDIQNVYNEFLRTQPEYSPLLGAQQQTALTYPSLVSKQPSGLGSALGGLASGIGSAIPGLLQVLHL